MLDELTAIQEVAWLYPGKRKTEPVIHLTDRTPRQQPLLDLLPIPMPNA